MFIYKKLKASDANTIAFEAHKEWNINKDNTSSLGITLVETSYSSASRDTYSSLYNDTLNSKQYFQLNHLFYKDALFNYGSLLGGIDYNTQEKRLYNKATIISLSQKTFGSSVQKGTFLFNNTYKDDSKGNIYLRTDTLTDFPLDKERTFYLAPVNGFKYIDLTRDPNTGEHIVNSPTTYNSLTLDDSLYINPVEYISCSLIRNATINCTEVDLTNGYVKVPNSNNYNFGDEDFTISFYYKNRAIATPKYILAKSKTKTVVGYPESNLNGSLKNTHGSASLLQPKEVDAGKSFPFEVVIKNSKLEFRRSDQDTLSSITGSSGAITNNSLYHVACVKSGSNLKLYIDGVQNGANQSDNTTQCKNKADLFIGTDPTISSSKLDNTEDQQISQLMIWNKALSTTEIANVSESIDGSPYVGNIFYENGIATLTSPKVNNSTLTSLVDNTGIINLSPSEFTQDDATANPAFRNTTFSSSLTFTSSIENIVEVDGSEIYPNLIYSSTYLSASLNGEIISLVSKPNAIPFDPYIINPIFSESVQNLEGYVQTSPVISPINGGPGTGSGESGTDGDSLVATSSAQFSTYTSLYLAENQTVTQSIEVLHISNSIDFITEDFSGDSSFGDTVFTSQADFMEYIDVSNNGLYVKAAALNESAQILPFYSGSLFKTSATNFPSADTIFKPVAYSNSTYNLPLGAIQGATYATFDSQDQYTGIIRIEAQPTPLNESPISFSYNITIGNYQQNVGDTNRVTVFLYQGEDGDGGSSLIDQKVHQAPFSTIEHTFTIGGVGVAGPQFPAANQTFFLQLKMQSISSLEGTATYQINNFSISSPDPSLVFKNLLKFRNSYTTDPSTLYDIDLKKISPTTNFSAPNNDLIALNQDAYGEDVGVKVVLWSQVDNVYTKVTEDFYASGSSFSANNFSYLHNTGDEGSETLHLDVMADVASNIIPSSINGTSDFNIYPTATVPISSSMGVGNASGKYTVKEISGSNIVKISSNLTSSFTDSDNISSAIIFNDISKFQILPSPSGPVNIIGFVGGDQTQILLDQTFLATSSFYATASLERGNFVSGSASIDITSTTKGLYKVENLTMASSPLVISPGFDFVDYQGIKSTQKVKIETKKNNKTVDTRYLSSDQLNFNIFETEESKLHLGILDNTDNISFVFSIVDGSNNITKSIKNEGFFINRIFLTKMTSSNEVTLVNDDVWQNPLLQLDFPNQSQSDLLQFSSSHINTGSAPNALIPFNTGAITASILSTSADFKTLYLTDNFLITSSLVPLLHNADGVQNGPFIISASYLLDQINANKEYTISQSFTVDNINDIANQGFGQTLSYKTIGGTTIINENYYEIDGYSSSINTIRDSQFNNTQIGFTFFVSGAASNKYPTGVITASNLNYTQSFTPTVKFTAISGSNISSGPGISADSFSLYEGYASDFLGITSSHAADPHTPDPPLYTLGKKDVGILELVSGQIKIDDVLFITASSNATGSSLSSSWNPGDYNFTPSNPIVAYNITPDMLGGTFDFTDLATLETSTYEITLIEEEGSFGELAYATITLSNLDGGNDAIQTTNANSLNATPPVTVNWFTVVANEFTIQYKNSHLIFENEYHCTVDEDEYNHTLNPTVRKLKDIDNGELAPFATGSNFKPYVTTVGLYNESGELLVVGKLGQPIRMSDETDTTFVLRYDT